jgi:spoIIIJ-associated protein
MKTVITTGKTVEEATELALQELGVPRDRVTVSVLTQPSRGRIFGLFGARNAEIEASVIPLNPMEETKKFVEDVLAAMKLRDVTVSVVENEPHAYTVRLTGESIGILIGRRGATLDSLQYLVNLVANKHSESFLRVTLDAEDYRKRRQETLEKLAERLANKAVQSRRDIMLEPMSSTERKIIHSHLQVRDDVVTFSHGDEPHRKVVISPKNKESVKGAKAGERRPRRHNPKRNS